MTLGLTASQAEWLRVRSYLQEHRHALALDAAGDYPDDGRVAGTPLLAAPGWQPAGPVPLQDIGLESTAPELIGADLTAPADPQPDLSAGAAPLLPERPDGTRYLRYSDALRELAAPAVFENRPTYRLTEADLTRSRLAFTRGRYFDGVDTGEAAAHEYAATRLGARSSHHPAGLRAQIADPCDLRRRPANLAISTLTLRLDQATGRASFLLHWRDPAKVGHAGGMYQVIPVGVFQRRARGTNAGISRCGGARSASSMRNSAGVRKTTGPARSTTMPGRSPGTWPPRWTGARSACGAWASVSIR